MIRWPYLLGIGLLAAATVAAARLQLTWPALTMVIVCSVAIAWSGSRVWLHPGAGVAVAGLFASMPLVQRNAGTLSLAPLLAIAMWLHGVTAFQQTGRAYWLAIAGGALGAGAIADGDALLALPALALVTTLALALIHEPSRLGFRTAIIPSMVCGVALLPFSIYLFIYPDWFLTRVSAYNVYDTQRFNVLQGAREVVSWVGLTARSGAYWHYFDPSFLFMSSGVSSPLSQPRVLLLPALVLLPLGIARVVTAAPRRVQLLILAGFLLAPCAGALIVRSPDPSRFLLAAPFGAMLMFAGLAHLMSDDRPARVVAGAVLACAVAIAAVAFALNAARALPLP